MEDLGLDFGFLLGEGGVLFETEKDLRKGREAEEGSRVSRTKGDANRGDGRRKRNGTHELSLLDFDLRKISSLTLELVEEGFEVLRGKK